MTTFDQIKDTVQKIEQSYENLNSQEQSWVRNLKEARVELQNRLDRETDILEKVRQRSELDKNSLEIVKKINKEVTNNLQKITELREQEEAKQNELERYLDNINYQKGMGVKFSEQALKLHEKREKQLKKLTEHLESTKVKHINQVDMLKTMQRKWSAINEVANTLLYVHRRILKEEEKLISAGQRIAQNWFKIKDLTGHVGSGLAGIGTLFERIQFFVGVIAKGFGSMLTKVNLFATIMTGIYNQTKSLVFELEKQASITAALTGRGRQYSEELYNASVLNREFAVTLSETGESFRSLFTTMTIFNQVSQETRKNLTLFTSKMQVLGVSSSVTASNLDNLTKSLGLSSRGAVRTAMEFFSLARNIGLDTRRIQADFRNVFSELSAYGERGIDVFKGLAAASKTTGVGIQRLQNIFGRTFDTFEGSADIAGKLNTILGRDMFNSVKLLYATEEERIRLIKEGVAASGRQFSSMTKFEKLALANAAGIKDMNEANRIFGMSLDAYDQMQLKAKLASSDQKKFNDAVQASSTFMKKFRIAFQNFAVAVQPIVEILNVAITLFASLFGWINRMSDSIRSLGGLWADFGAGLIRIVSIWTMFTGAVLALLPVLKVLGIISVIAFLPFIKTAAIILGVVSAIYALAKAVQFLRKWWTKKSSPAFWEMPSVMSTGMDKYRTSIIKTTPKVETLATTSKVLHETQIKKSSPALWQVGSVMSEGMDQYNNSIKQNTSTVNSNMKSISNSFSKSSNVSNNQNSNSTNVSNMNMVTHKIDQLITTLNERKTSGKRNIKVDVSFLDIDKTRQEFQKAVMEAFEETYG